MPLTESSRIHNTKRNLISALIRKSVSIVLPFIVRTILLQTLGAQIQGLNSLFISIINVLNLAELGFSSAIVYILYKPVAANDHDTVCAIIGYLKKVYQIVGLIMLCLGIFMMPLLPSFIANDSLGRINYYIPYALYLINAVISYFGFAYKDALLIASQREDIINTIYTWSSIVLKLTQILILVLCKNYYLYSLAFLFSTVLSNLLTALCARKCFPSIEAKGNISSEIRASLHKQLKGIVIGKVGDVARNGCDSMFISAFVGLVAVAIYDNYFYIFSAIYGIVYAITNAMQASVGNSIAVETCSKNYHDLLKFSFLFSWITGWCAICLCCLYQPFMLIWMNGNTEMLFSMENMLLFVLYFYAISMNNIRNLYVNGAGLYWELRHWFILEAVGNIVLNLALGYFLGVTGIILATIITIFVCNFITRTNVLFRLYFKQSPMVFYRKHFVWFAASVVNCAITYWLCSFITIGGLWGLLLKGLLCALVPNAVYLAMYCKTAMFRESAAFVRNVLKKQ